MIFNAENILLIGSILLFVSIVVSKTGYRFGIPTLLVFLLVGMLFGSDGLGLQFHDAGEAQFIGMMALSIILFSGGMDTKYSDIKPVLPQGILLSTFGVLLTTIFTGFFIYWISGFSNVSITMSLMTAMLLAATMSSTDPASVFNILRSQSMNLKHNLRPMLELESGSNDPYGVYAYYRPDTVHHVGRHGGRRYSDFIPDSVCCGWHIRIPAGKTGGSNHQQD